MAKQRGIMPFSGSLGEVTGRKINGEFILQAKSTLTADRIKTDSKFAGTRKMSNEFGLANIGAKILRRVFKAAIKDCLDTKLQQRLVKKLRTMITEDAISPKGERNLLCGNIDLLKDFWWNKNISISHAIAAEYVVYVDRKAGIVTFHFPSFVPKDALTGTPGATHYRIIASAAEMNWKEDAPLAKVYTTDYLPYNEKPTNGFDCILLLNEESELPIISCLSILWYQEVAGEKELLKDLKYNTAGIVDVNVA